MVVYPPVERATANLSFRPTSPATMSAATATSTSAAPVVLLDRTPTIPAASTKYIPVAASNKSTILPVTKALPLTLPLTKNRQCQPQKFLILFSHQQQILMFKCPSPLLFSLYPKLFRFLHILGKFSKYPHQEKEG